MAYRDWTACHSDLRAVDENSFAINYGMANGSAKQKIFGFL
jgi:hypothetical protein